MKTMATASASQAYGEPWYWDKRYTGESGPFDWYQKYPSLAPLVNLYLPRRSSKILAVGCGNSGTLDSLLCGRSNTRHNADRMLDEVARVLKDRGVYILITCGAPRYRVTLLRDMNMWTIKLHVIDKFVVEGKSEDPARMLTDPISLYDNGSSMEALLGENADVHYIYVCTKVISTGSSQSRESKVVE